MGRKRRKTGKKKNKTYVKLSLDSGEIEGATLRNTVVRISSGRGKRRKVEVNNKRKNPLKKGIDNFLLLTGMTYQIVQQKTKKGKTSSASITLVIEKNGQIQIKKERGDFRIQFYL